MRNLWASVVRTPVPADTETVALGIGEHDIRRLIRMALTGLRVVRPIDSASAQSNEPIYLGVEIVSVGMKIQMDPRKLLGPAFTGIHRNGSTYHTVRGLDHDPIITVPPRWAADIAERPH